MAFAGLMSTDRLAAASRRLTGSDFVLHTINDIGASPNSPEPDSSRDDAGNDGLARVRRQEEYLTGVHLWTVAA
jgi:hypothetical protein